MPECYSVKECIFGSPYITFLLIALVKCFQVVNDSVIRCIVLARISIMLHKCNLILIHSFDTMFHFEIL